MKFSHLAVAALLPLAACATNTPAAMVALPTMSTPQLNQQDNAFMTSAAQSDAFEIQSSQLALEKSRNPAVKAYAQRMVNEHGATSQKMIAAAQTRGIAMAAPGQLDPTQSEMVTQLQSLDGRAFDRAYMSDQIASHRMTVQFVQAEIDGGTDPDTKALATAELPMVQDHMRLAQRIRMGR